MYVLEIEGLKGKILDPDELEAAEVGYDRLHSFYLDQISTVNVPRDNRNEKIVGLCQALDGHKKTLPGYIAFSLLRGLCNDYNQPSDIRIFPLIDSATHLADQLIKRYPPSFDLHFVRGKLIISGLQDLNPFFLQAKQKLSPENLDQLQIRVKDLYRKARESFRNGISLFDTYLHFSGKQHLQCYRTDMLNTLGIAYSMEARRLFETTSTQELTLDLQNQSSFTSVDTDSLVDLESLVDCASCDEDLWKNLATLTGAARNVYMRILQENFFPDEAQYAAVIINYASTLGIFRAPDCEDQASVLYAEAEKILRDSPNSKKLRKFGEYQYVYIKKK